MNIEEINNLFIQVFDCEPDAPKLKALIETSGIEKIADILRYYIINGIFPPAEGKRFNPYGLLYKVSKNWNQ